MADFWFLSLALLVLALMFVFVPALVFVRKQGSLKNDAGESINESRQRQNVLIFKERLAELDAELVLKKHTAETYEQLKAELEAALLIDVESELSSQEALQDKSGLGVGNLVVVACSALLVVVVSFGGYFKWGSYDDVIQVTNMHFDDQEVQQARSAAEQGDMSSLLEQLYSKLQQSPDNIEGWTLLARSAMNTEHYQFAIEAYNQIIRILNATGENTASVYGLLAQAYYYQNEGVISPDVQNSLDQAFNQNPDEVNSLGLMAIDAYSHDDFSTAITYWKRILLASPDHPSRVSIETGIERAQAALGLPPESNAPEQANNAGSVEAAITVEVSISPAILEKVSADDIVFIFASPASKTGPAMPLAASRHKVNDLPVTVVLNDQSAMGPMAKLSQVKRANVVARISRSGQAIAQKGDFEGRQSSVDVYANESIQIQIIDAL